MKVKTINRNEEELTRERSQDLKKVHRNYDPALHQFQKAHEYIRALNAAKLERVFAKPFIAALPHSDGITCLARNPRILNSLLAGAADGDIKIWDIPAKRTLRRLKGHTGAVRGISFAPDGETCVSCSTDCSVSTANLQTIGLGAVPSASSMLNSIGASSSSSTWVFVEVAAAAACSLL
eukprot:GHRR01028166.1.p1 GENE.GHRR01028166.1~~GHRR01028166.1.p1  ORF type:complete len:179 (+),score=51.66 GHRR01028166.1:109-645(+)